MNTNLSLVMDTIIQVRKYEHKIAQLEAEIEQLKRQSCVNCYLPAFKCAKVCSECGELTWSLQYEGECCGLNQFMYSSDDTE